MMIRLLTGLRKSQNFHEVGIKMQLENSFSPNVLPLITTLHCRFMSECDSELIAVYIAQKMREGASLEEGMKESLSGLDGVFTYFVATSDSLGMAKDTMAAKPLVLYESDDLVAMGSEEIAIRSVLPHEIDTYDPFDGEVKVWQI